MNSCPVKCLKEALSLLQEANCWAGCSRSEPDFFFSIQSWSLIQQNFQVFPKIPKLTVLKVQNTLGQEEMTEFYSFTNQALGLQPAATSSWKDPSCLLGLSEVRAVLCG